MANEERLRTALAGIETVRGTGVTPTRRIQETVRLRDEYAILDLTEDAGTYDGWYDHELGPVTVTGTVEGAATFDDLPFWLRHGVKNVTGGTSDGGTPAAYAWSFAPSASVDDLASSTVQHGEPDNVYESEMVMLPSFGLRGDVDSDASWMLTGSLVARNMAPLPAGFEPGIPRRNRTRIKAAGTRLFIDDAAADIGDTQVLGRFISFNLDWNNNVVGKRFMEDEDAISTRIGRGRREVTGTIRLEFLDDDEKAKLRAGDRRAIRIERTGPIIHDAVANRVRIDIPNARWVSWEDPPRENNMTISFGFRALVDATAGYAARIEVVNAFATAA